MSLTADANILDTVQHCHLEIGNPDQPRPRPEIQFNSEEKAIIHAEITHLLELGVIEPAVHCPNEYISSIFVRKKKSGKYRMILNLKALNKYVEKHHFKMDTLWSAVRLMTPNCFMASLDLKDAYYSVPIAEEHRKYLRFYWQGSLYQYTCMPNGLSSAPRVFTKLLKPVYSNLRQKGHLNVGYIDDSYLQGSDTKECLLNISDTQSLFSSLGFVINMEKSAVIPAQRITFLGFVLDSVSMTITLTIDKKAKVKAICEAMQHKHETTITEVAQLVGTLVSSLTGVQFGKLHYRNLEIEKNIALRENKGDYEALMSLSPSAKEDLAWWIENVDKVFNPISHGNPVKEIRTDASKKGWGAYLEGDTTQGLWSTTESQLHINELELMAIQFALQAFVERLSNKHVKVLCDNSTAVTYINAMGGTKSPSCNEIAYNIWVWCVNNNVWLTATHIAGVENIEADKESRLFNDRTEWTLKKEIFVQITAQWGIPEIDLFATRLNTQVPRFVSWKPDPASCFVDAFTINWDSWYFYAFPPFCQIHRCLQKMLEEEVPRGIMIVPLWPTQVGWPQLLRMIIAIPLVLPRHQDLLSLSHSPQTLHPLRKKLTMLACLLSGSLSRTEEFRRKLLSSSWPPGGMGQRNNTVPTSQNGKTFVIKGKLIPFNHL